MDAEYDGRLRMAARTLFPSERVDQARETHAHVHDGDLAHEVIDSIARDPEMSGVTWAGGELICSYGKSSGEMRSLRMTVMSGFRREICWYQIQVNESKLTS